MVNREFNQRAYDTYDTLGKAVAARWVEAYGFAIVNVSSGSAAYEPDLLVRDPKGDFVETLFGLNSSEYFYVEPEIKARWASRNFSYRDVHIPERKKKYLGLKYPVIFIVINKPCTAFFTVSSAYLADCPVIEKYANNNLETFFSVNKKDVLLWEQDIITEDYFVN